MFAVAVTTTGVWPTAAQSYRVNTSRGRLRALTDPAGVPDSCVVLTVGLDSIGLYGYDKPQKANKETFFLKNGTSFSIGKAMVEIEYLDMQSRQLHVRRYEVDIEIPPGQTRKIDIPTWDRQQSFYYYLSAKPKKVSATPYKIKASVVAVMPAVDLKPK